MRADLQIEGGGWAAAPGRLRAAAIKPKPRPRVHGKFIYIADDKFFVRGVTYGPLATDEDHQYRTPDIVGRDFDAIAAAGFNTIRTYTIPPRWLLDAAHQRGLYVMVGLPWEQHVAFLESRRVARDIERRVRLGVKSCTGHPAILCYTIGNEIPAHIVRWLGRERVEKYLERLYRAAKSEDPGALVTYVNYPSTEYLDLPFVDLVSFNVYLEREEKLEAYLARLQNLSGDRPLLLAEVGLDSMRNGEENQAKVLEWQIRAIFAGGCAGAFVFAWTDEWARGGMEITDWDFGLTRRDRTPKPALGAVSRAMRDVPFPPKMPWPSISVVICSYNGSRTIRQALEGVSRLKYPDVEVIVVDDGSRDSTAKIAAEFDFVRLISTSNRGLSAARNIGWQEATGEIVAYLDDDAWPDEHWLMYLATTFMTTSHVGVGGPNLPPPDDGPIAKCVAHAPGGPIHVLVSDTEAEHLPGCNMAFRRSALEAIGGFDAQFRIAGDDVDACWRLQERGWTLGFSAAAVVWHRRRNSIKTFWRQQFQYGRAEADLERKWPQKYNAVGHPTWTGRLYGRAFAAHRIWGVQRIYHGTWGSALFQSAAEKPAHPFFTLATIPEWYIVLACLAIASAIGLIWPPLLLAIPIFIVCLSVVLMHAAGAGRMIRREAGQGRWNWTKYFAVTALLHLTQPISRLCGRISRGLTPWRKRGVSGFALPWKRTFKVWSEHWQAGDERLKELESHLRTRGAVVRRGGDFDTWDLELRAGILGAVRMCVVCEEHGHGHQMVRFRAWPRCTAIGRTLIGMLLLVALADAHEYRWQSVLICAVPAWLLALRTLQEAGSGMAAVKQAMAADEGRQRAAEIIREAEKLELGVPPHATVLANQHRNRLLKPPEPPREPAPAAVAAAVATRVTADV